MKLFKRICVFSVCALITFVSSFSTFAANVEPYSANGKILSVSHGGNRDDHPAFSLEAIDSAFALGADFVSVNIAKTSDGTFVVCKSENLKEIASENIDGKISDCDISLISTLHLKDSQCNIPTLGSAIECAEKFSKTLIIDFDWEERQLVYDYLVEQNALDNAILRVRESRKEIKRFISLTDSKCSILPAYHGNILFNARGYITSLSKTGCQIISLGTKNSFGVIFHQSVISAFSKNYHNSRAMISTVDPDECGQRPDNSFSWDDLIDRGYSVIETDCIKDLVKYIFDTQNSSQEVIALINKADSISTSNLSAKSKTEIAAAKETANKAVSTLSSYKTITQAKSMLNRSLSSLTYDNSDSVSKEGVFSITFGKVLAIILVTAALTIVQFFFYFRRADKKLPAKINNIFNKK